MQPIITVATAILLTATITTNAIDNAISRTRNQYLRLYVWYKKHKMKNFASSLIEKTTKTYNFMLSKYYDANIFYYSLSENERELLEQIINSSY
jgi:hypothetical protein